jgi:hypothetical protein
VFFTILKVTHGYNKHTTERLRWRRQTRSSSSSLRYYYSEKSPVINIRRKGKVSATEEGEGGTVVIRLENEWTRVIKKTFGRDLKP